MPLKVQKQSISMSRKEGAFGVTSSAVLSPYFTAKHARK